MSEVSEIDAIIRRMERGLKVLKANDDILTERYLSNIKVIEENFPQIYTIIKDYKPSNNNIFVEEDGSLNLLFPDSGYTLFSETPFQQIEEKYKRFISNPDRTYVNLSVELTDRSRHEFYLSKIHVDKEKAKSSAEKLTIMPRVVGGIVLFGFDLGYQLIRILDEHFAKHIYIYEENLDLFYYSLFAIDWEWVVNEMVERDCSLHFFLGIDESEFINQYLSVLRLNGMYMAAHTYLYSSYSAQHIQPVLTEFRNQFAKQVMGWGFFDDGVIGIGQYLARQNKTYLAVKPEQDLRFGFNKNLDIPVFILGNGPSLDDNIEFVKAHRNDVILVSCGTTLNTLSKYGIKPDYHVDVERMRHTAEKISFVDEEFLKGITALTVNVMHPEFYQYFEKSIIGLKPGEPISSLMRNRLVSEENRSRLMDMHFSSPIVANLALSYVLQMGFCDVYMIGVDCGFRSPELHHSKVSGYYTKDGENSGLMPLASDHIRREANFGGIALTTSIMDMSRIQLELLISFFRPKNRMFKCYNLSDGIKIKGTEPLRAEDALIAAQAEGRKNKVKSYVWDNFVVEENSDFSDWSSLDVKDEFELFCDEVTNILDNDFQTKEDILKNVSTLNNLVMLQYNLGKSYNIELMFGSFVYFANELLDYVLSVEVFDMKEVRSMLNIFKDFVQEMPSMLEDPRQSVDKREDVLKGKYHA